MIVDDKCNWRFTKYVFKTIDLRAIQGLFSKPKVADLGVADRYLKK